MAGTRKTGTISMILNCLLKLALQKVIAPWPRLLETLRQTILKMLT